MYQTQDKAGNRIELFKKQLLSILAEQKIVSAREEAAIIRKLRADIAKDPENAAALNKAAIKKIYKDDETLTIQKKVGKMIKIKIQELEKINADKLYVYYRATNLATGEERKSDSVEYVGDDILSVSSMSEDQLNAIPMINGLRYGDEVLVSEEVKEYSDDNAELELTAQGWATPIHNAISYVLF